MSSSITWTSAPSGQTYEIGVVAYPGAGLRNRASCQTRSEMKRGSTCKRSCRNPRNCASSCSGTSAGTGPSHPTVTHQFDSATGASRYVFRVRAYKTLQISTRLEGSWRNSGTVPVLPAPRQVGTVTATRDVTDDRNISVTWTAPSSGTTPTDYDVEYKQDNASDWENADTGHTASPYPFTHAGSGASTYQFRVRASTTLQSGDKLKGSWRTSNTVPKLRAPNQVGSVTATRQTNDETSIDVSWTAPSGATPTGYEVQYKADSGDWETSTQVDVTSGTSTTISSLAGGSKYQFRVRAYKTLTSGTKLEGSWRTSNTVAGLPAPSRP